VVRHKGIRGRSARGSPLFPLAGRKDRRSPWPCAGKDVTHVRLFSSGPAESGTGPAEPAACLSGLLRKGAWPDRPRIPPHIPRRVIPPAAHTCHGAYPVQPKPQGDRALRRRR
jgi:hypothetical protein